MLTCTGPATDSSVGSPFPPLTAYADQYSAALGELSDAASWLGSAIDNLDAMALYVEGLGRTFFDGSSFDLTGTPGGNDLGAATAYLNAAAGRISDQISAGTPCPSNISASVWQNALQSHLDELNQVLTDPGSCNLDATGHVTGSAWHDTLISLRSAINSDYATVDTDGCRLNENPSGGGTGGGGDGTGGSPITSVPFA